MNSAKPWIALLMMTFLCPNIIHAGYFDACSTPDGQSGNCVPIVSCASIESQLKAIKSGSAQLTQEYRNFLQQSDCGKYDGARHICCPSDQLQYNSNTLSKLRDLKCGQTTGMRVAHGTEVKLGTRPWMALLKYKTENGDAFLCGGTLISENFVLTAAHCIVGHENQIYQVRLGEHRISDERDCVFQGRKEKCSDPVEDIDIDKVFTHENYSQLNIYDDIALLRLNKTVQNTRYIKPICLPITEELKNLEKTIENFFVSGWGATEKGGNSDVLLEARIQNKDRDECFQAFSKVIRQTQICAGGEENRDSCKGDSGGPIQGPGSYVDQYKIRMIQFGIVSLGVVSCGRAGLPGLYTNVAEYMHWITDKMDSP